MDERTAPMTKEEWIRRELANMPPRSRAWKRETLRLWGWWWLSPAEPDDSDAGSPDDDQ